MSADVKNLLVELFVEELPPKALKTLSESFGGEIEVSLVSQDLIDQEARNFFSTNGINPNSSTPIIEYYATPRRLGVCLKGVISKAPDKQVQQKLMPVSVALDGNGKPTPALLKKLTAMGMDESAVPNLKRQSDGKVESLFLDAIVKGVTLQAGLNKAIEESLRKLPIPKVMSYQLSDGWTTVNFVRPAHGLVALHGSDVVPVSILGLQASNITHGHRFEAKNDPIVISNADTYASQLESEGAVIASFDARRALIVEQLHALADNEGLKPIEDQALLDEVTALVERPNVLMCKFEEEYLQVPSECLILTMKANQKYFPLLDKSGKLTNKFLIVSNIRPADPSRVIEGNERVVRPRLADAKFFFDQDRRQTLESRRDRLKNIVYHNRLGSIWERSERVSKLARRDVAESISGMPYMGSPLSINAQRAAELAKTDLVTNMVGEFPELQGIMGRYYALNDKEDAEVAEAIREHYLPRGAGDELPRTQTGIALALADKMETIFGIFYIDQLPTGTKDPFGLRRAALGILRICIETKISIDLKHLISSAQRVFEEFHSNHDAASPHLITHNKQLNSEVYEYIMERLRGYYLEGTTLEVTTEMFDAVLANRPASPLDFDHRLRALHSFLKLSDAQSLAAANKRISNILKKVDGAIGGEVEKKLLNEPAEKELFSQLQSAEKDTAPMFAARNYQEALARLATLRPAVDQFFDGVMVMADDTEVRNNRLALLARLRNAFLQVADLSRLPG